MQFLALWGLILLICVAFWAAVVIALSEIGLALPAALSLLFSGAGGGRVGRSG